MKKNHYFLFALVFIVFLVFSAGYVSAYEVIDKFPTIPGLPPISSMDPNKPDLGAFVGYFFGLGIYLVGALSLISFTIGAVGLIVSGDSPDAASSAKDRMKGAIIGVVLTLTSFIIIQTINPKIATPVLTPLGGVGGVFYSSGQYQLPAPMEEPDTSTRPSGYNQLKYCCNSSCSGGDGPALLIWQFPNKGLEAGNNNLLNVNVARISCGGSVGISFGSFRTAFETPGIYYFLGSGCNGYSSVGITGSDNRLAKPFDKNIKSVKIINSDQSRFGVIFHKEIGLNTGGQCSKPIINTGASSICENIPGGMHVSAVDVFALEKNPELAGDGVTFYSEPYGWNTGAQAGYYITVNKAINPYFKIEADKMCFDYKNIDRPDAYKFACESKCGGSNNNYSGSGNDCTTSADCPSGEACLGGVCSSGEEGSCSYNACETFQNCPGSIRVSGNYLVAVYSKMEENKFYCQTFRKDAVNLKAEPVTTSIIDSVHIISTK